MKSIGYFKGKEVIAIERDEYDNLVDIDPSIVYAVNNARDKYSWLVINNQIVGTMDRANRVTPGKGLTPYKKAKKKVVKPETPVESNLFKELSKPVDSFFEGLKKSWEDMGV